MGHHALLDLEDLVRMTVAAAQVRDTQVTRIHESDELRRFMIRAACMTGRGCPCMPRLRETGPDVGLLEVVGSRVAAVAIDAAKPHRLGLAVRLVLSLVA